MSPMFPLRVELDDGEIWELHDRDDVAWNLEWVDTDTEPSIHVWDKEGRAVRLKVEACDVLLCELVNDTVTNTS